LIKSCDELRCTDYTNVAAAGGCPSSSCRICSGICVDRALYDNENCDAVYFDSTTCKGCHNCTLNSKILVGSDKSYREDQQNQYCVQYNSTLGAPNCSSPLTCSAINLPEFNNLRKEQCESAGCKFENGECKNEKCFNFFLPGFVLQPIFLMVIGFIKDVIVLLLIGVFGDLVMRPMKRKTIWFKFWWKKWDKKRIKLNFERTIFVNDSKCRDHTSEKGESFEQY
jgi:hypothetical protein